MGVYVFAHLTHKGDHLGMIWRLVFCAFQYYRAVAKMPGAPVDLIYG